MILKVFVIVVVSWCGGKATEDIFGRRIQEDAICVLDRVHSYGFTIKLRLRYNQSQSMRVCKQGEEIIIGNDRAE